MNEYLIEEEEFRYVERGEGKPMIFLHGLFGALSNFKEVFDHYSKRYKILMPMLPIYDLPLINTNVKNLAKFLDRFIKHKGLDQVNLLGNSLGGHVALVYCAAHPEKVNSLVLTGSSGLYENAFGGSFPRREDKRYLKDKIALTFYNPEMVTDELVDECHEAVNNRNKVIRIIAFAKSAIRHNMRKELPGMKMPVCLIWGKNDTITPPRVAEEFHQHIPNSQLFWIDECGHAPMMEQPTTFNNLLDSWLEETGAIK